ncbi:MAG TPA: hypothetical protein VLJ61_15770 [Pyrinomonadaceae bacterium]|nr:hypothetical protein [Pyrinomonadaceae bacterium]
MILPAVALGAPQAVKKMAITATPAVPKTATATPSAPQQRTTQKVLPTKVPAPAPAPPSNTGVAGSTYYPTSQPIETARPVNVTALAMQEALEPSSDVPTEIKAFNAPKGDKPEHHFRTINAPNGGVTSVGEEQTPNAPPPSATGPSPGPTKTFKGQFLSSTSIPPDTMGAVGTNFVVTSSNDFMRIQTRDGVELQRFTINSFWSTATIKGVAVASAFDTKVYYDRFNDHFILVSSLNGPGINSGMGLAVTQTNDPTGTWFRYTQASDPASTASAGHAIDYPSVGINKNWIAVDENVFNYSGTAFTTYYGQQIFVFDKAAAYANTLSTASLFEAQFGTGGANCVNETDFACGFTMAPAITEDNTTDTEYISEDWDETNGQLRLSKITGTPSTPVLTVGTQFPQSPFSWGASAARIGTANNCGGTCSGGYMPQRQQSLNAASGTRIMANDSRIQNAVLRDGTLWTTHTVMLASTPTPAGTGFGTTNPDTHSGVQWWQIDPTVETGGTDPITGLGTNPLQRGRIEDATADNCHNGAGGTRTTGICTSTATQHGTFFAFPNISVNKNDDVLIGFSQFSPLTYPSSAYAIRLHTDPVNTTRDPVVFHGGQANYNIGGGSGTARQNRWGDYSAAQTDPLDDTTFWTVQEYGGTVRDFGIGLAGNWETWWSQVNATAAAPATTGNLIISEFRLRGPQGARDEYVNLYNPGSTPIIVSTTDSSDGWSLATQTTAGVVSGVAVIPNGTVIPARGHFLIADNPDGANGPTVVYSLNSYPGSQVRGAESDTGWSFDVPDTNGIAIFKTANATNFTAAFEMDAAGPATLPAGSIYREGTGYGALPTSNLQYVMYRDTSNGGNPQDSNNNAADFIFADTAGTAVAGLGQRLGAPGPANLDGPVQRNATMPGFLLDQTATSNIYPNRERDMTSDPVNNSTFGTMTIRRRVVNNTGQPVTKLRFRVVNMTTFPSTGLADLRVRTVGDTVVTVNDPATCAAAGSSAPCTVTARGTTLEAPPAQTLGGGMNSTVSVGSITLSAPLANGASADVQFLLGIQTSGTYRFFINVEAVP